MSERPYAGGRFTLELDQRQPVGFVTSIDGGHFKSDGVTSQIGDSGYVVTKYPGKPKFDDLTITVGMAMSPAFWKWVAASLEHKPQRRTGAVVGYDFNGLEKSRRSFYEALIAEIGFPALDASSKSLAMLSVKIAPERLTYAKGDNSKLKFEQGKDEASLTKKWLACNFRFELDRFKQDASLRNAKIDAFTVKQNIITHQIGHEMEARKEPGRLEIPQLQVTFPEANLDKWMAWYDVAVAKGNRKDQYTTGSITYLASDVTTELMRLELSGVSLLALDVEKYEAGKEAIAKVKATLNVEELKFIAGKGNVPSSPG